MSKHALFIASAMAAGAVFAPTAAEACGGFFCSNQPVDQQAERILFVEEEGDQWSVYVEIMYQGEAEDFAWLLPVPEVPTLDTWYGQAFNALDQITQPVFQPENWGCFAAPEAAGGEADADGLADDANRGPDILAREQVGPFDTVTLASNDPRETVEWLRENGFRIVPAMEPFIAMYSEEGMKFTAMKLQPGEEVESIRPIKMTYTSQNPMIPLRLTSVAAMPEMGIKVWVLAKSRFGPTNVPAFEIADEEVVFNPRRGDTNYLALVARKVDELAAPGFITEFAQPTEEYAQTIADSFVPDRAGEEAVEARDSLAELLRSRPYLTRMYTRLSPEEMGFDPIFEPHSGDHVENFHVIPAPEGADACDPPEAVGGEDGLCAFEACGAGGRCAVADVQDEDRPWLTYVGCACAPGALARTVPDPTSPTGVRTSCVDGRLNFLSDPNLSPVTGNIALPDPCTADFCGANGECVALNGTPTCRCAEGFVATHRLNDENMPMPSCEAPVEAIPATFYLTELPEPMLPYPGKPAVSSGGKVAQGCTAADTGAAGLFLLGLLGLPLARRRRR